MYIYCYRLWNTNTRWTWIWL